MFLVMPGTRCFSPSFQRTMEILISANFPPPCPVFPHKCSFREFGTFLHFHFTSTKWQSTLNVLSWMWEIWCQPCSECISQEFPSWLKGAAILTGLLRFVCGSCNIKFLLYRLFWTAWKLFSCFMNRFSFDGGMTLFSMMFFNSVFLFQPPLWLISLYIH